MEARGKQRGGVTGAQVQAEGSRVTGAVPDKMPASGQLSRSLVFFPSYFEKIVSSSERLKVTCFRKHIGHQS